jgi:Epoxide hydrolase N terminus
MRRMVPFHIQVAEEILIDLRERLARTRWPDELPDAGWDYGTNRAYLQQLVTYWREQYDWRAQERLLNTFPQFQTKPDFRLSHHARDESNQRAQQQHVGFQFAELP